MVLGPKATGAHTPALGAPRDHDPRAKVPLGALPLASQTGHQTKFVLPDTQPAQMQTVELGRGFLWRKPGEETGQASALPQRRPWWIRIKPLGGLGRGPRAEGRQR